MHLARAKRTACAAFDDHVKHGVATDLAAITKGGPARYAQRIEIKGELVNPPCATTAPTSSTPSPPPTTTPGNPSSASAASTSSPTATPRSARSRGDVWVVSGIDDKLEHLKWRRFAAGLFQPLGLKIVNDQVYVLGRDQITRLVDLNGDGEADFYENFNNDGKVTPGNATPTPPASDRPAGELLLT